MKNGALFSVPEHRVMRLRKTEPIYIIAIVPSGLLALFLPKGRKIKKATKDRNLSLVAVCTLITLIAGANR
jgi:hypothetical protein